MKYGYARVSTYSQKKDGNSLEHQENKLLEEGCEKIFVDAYTGTKTTERPKFQKMLKQLKAGDMLVVTKLDRFSRSASDGIKLIDDLLEKGIKVYILNMGLMDNSTTGKLIRNIFLCFAEFERDMIVERTKEGKVIAKQNEGYKDGRPKKFSKKQINHAISLKENGMSFKQVTEVTGISRATLYREITRRKCEEVENQ